MTLKANETCSCQVKVSLLDPTCMCYMQAEPLDCTYVVETIQDFLIELDIKPLMHLIEISIFH